jgi:glycosyltransferase involved in cell wall biosynthesis
MTRIAVVIPCFRVRERILPVLGAIGDECDAIFVVDDGCPEKTGALVEARVTDPRVRVLYHERNQGVGAAVLTGYRAALAAGADIIVKIDGDGQMDPADVPVLVAPIADGIADYAKGNRFSELAHLPSMPAVRIVGNAGLSFITKISSGYWDVFDPTNGYTAIHAMVAARLPFDRIATDYFFESDMLFHLGQIGAVVRDVPLPARYGEERSGLRLPGTVVSFGARHAANTARRLFYSYFLRDFSAASVELLIGVLLLAFGVTFGAVNWAASVARGVGAYTGTIMLAALSVILGVQLLLAFQHYDVRRVPREPLHPQLLRRRRAEERLRPPRAPVDA